MIKVCFDITKIVMLALLEEIKEKQYLPEDKGIWFVKCLLFNRLGCELNQQPRASSVIFGVKGPNISNRNHLNVTINTKAEETEQMLLIDVDVATHYKTMQT